MASVGAKIAFHRGLVTNSATAAPSSAIVAIPNIVANIRNSSAENSRWFGSRFGVAFIFCACLTPISENSPVNPAMTRTSNPFILSTRCLLVGVSTI